MRAVFCALVLCACQGAPPDLPTAEVVRGDFAVTHFEGGEVQAASGEVVVSPRIAAGSKSSTSGPKESKSMSAT